MNTTPHQVIWKNCLKIIKDNITPASYNTWFAPILPVKLESNALTIQVPSQFFYEYIEEHFLDLLKKALRKELGKEAKLEYHIVMDAPTHAGVQATTMKLPTSSNSHLVNHSVRVPLNIEEHSIKNPFVIPGLKTLNIDSQLNPVYSFSNFVEGECNRLARAAGFAVTQNPGKIAFNPLFIYGPSGFGKTHLSQAIGIESKERFPEKTVLYVNANKLVTQYSEAAVKNTRNDFINFYQMIDVLIVDDIQELIGKEGTQEVFFHIFNHLHQSNKQLVLTSDKPPIELQGLEQRLLSRFKWGLQTDLQNPDFETRVSIIKRKNYIDGIEMPNDVIEYIATHVSSNVRDIEGALISLLAQATLNRKEIKLELAREIVDKLVKNTKKEISIDYIQRVVCNYFNIGEDEIKNNTRKREIVQARQISMFFAKSLTKCSLATIGAQIGGKDHATVLHACKTVNNLMETDKSFKTQVEEIEKKLKI